MIIIAILDEHEEFIEHKISIVDNKEFHVSAKGVKEYSFCPVRLSKRLSSKKWNTNNLIKLETLLKGSIENKGNSRQF